mmetsp:Transcript_70558/g.204601  ORF Transcript_70558/g.204601 Transcript_70558/m.204601 type:complete len:860 (+) Transcript_70558:3-2582(+)
MSPAIANTPPLRGHLARTGWGVLSGSKLPGLPTPPSTPSSRSPSSPEQEGKRLVSEVASSWSQKYIFHIRYGGTREGRIHYECIFSRPTDDKPVPTMVVHVHFMFIPGSGAQAPRLFFRFEEADLRHEWKLVKDSAGVWRAEMGQQSMSLRQNAFERFLDSYVRSKDTIRQRGINLKTMFEEPRLVPPPACEHEVARTGSKLPFSRMSSTHSRKSEASEGEFRPGARTPQSGRKVEASREMAETMEGALKAANMYSTKVVPPSSLAELLANVLDAADEDNIGKMSHYEVSRLLMATLPGFGLEAWDIHRFLTYTKEDAEGFIDSRALVDMSQSIVFPLSKRRKEYADRGFPGLEVPIESIRHCFGDEITLTVEDLHTQFEACAAVDPSRALYYGVGDNGVRSVLQSRDVQTAGSGAGSRPSNGQEDVDGDEEKELMALKRRYVRECLNALIERISPQESAMLMQMLPEDESGFVMIDELTERLEHLRAEALHNAVVPCSVKFLREHLVTRFREVGMDEFGRMKLWKIKEALLKCQEICISRLQIHVLLCLADPNSKGDVKVDIFAGMCSSIIPHMCNAKIFAATAERLMLEHAEAAKERQNAELAALGAARVATPGDGEEAPVEKKVEVDQESVERTLIQVFSLVDDTRKPTPVLPPETIFKLLIEPTDQQIQGLCLDELEATGLVAEMNLDANGEVPYHDFVKRWVPIMFELRKNPLLGAYLKNGAAETLGFPEPNFAELEAFYPLLPPGHKQRILEQKERERKAAEAAAAATEEKPAEGRRVTKERRAATKERTTRRISTLPGSRADDEVCRLPSKGNALSCPVQEQEPPPGRGYQRRKAMQRSQTEGNLCAGVTDA